MKGGKEKLKYASQCIHNLEEKKKTIVSREAVDEICIYNREKNGEGKEKNIFLHHFVESGGFQFSIALSKNKKAIL